MSVQTSAPSSPAFAAPTTSSKYDAPVDPYLEAAEIHRRVIAAGGPALIFRHVTGADIPMVTNLFGPRAAPSWPSATGRFG